MSGRRRVSLNLAQIIITICFLIISLVLPVSSTCAATLSQDNDPAQCQALYEKGMTLISQGDDPGALETFQEALVCYQQIGDRYGEGIILQSIADIYKRTGQDDTALNYY